FSSFRASTMAGRLEGSEKEMTTMINETGTPASTPIAADAAIGLDAARTERRPLSAAERARAYRARKRLRREPRRPRAVTIPVTEGVTENVTRDAQEAVTTAVTTGRKLATKAVTAALGDWPALAAASVTPSTIEVLPPEPPAARGRPLLAAVLIVV